jgi:outer membrane protein OmpA-like peptidoglycan-associated protein
MDRALSVLMALEEDGISGGQLSAMGYGALRPLAANFGPPARRRNRRVELLIIPVEGTKSPSAMGTP